MLDKILKETGLPYREARFLKPPDSTYLVFNDSIERRGGDTINLITDHDITLELYSYKPDPVAEKKIEDQLDLNAIEWVKQARYWIQEEQIYQVIYEFSYTIKGGH